MEELIAEVPFARNCPACYRRVMTFYSLVIPINWRKRTCGEGLVKGVRQEPHECGRNSNIAQISESCR